MYEWLTLHKETLSKSSQSDVKREGRGRGNNELAIMRDHLHRHTCTQHIWSENQCNWGKPERAPKYRDCIVHMLVYVCLLGPATYHKFQMNTFWKLQQNVPPLSRVNSYYQTTVSAWKRLGMKLLKLRTFAAHTATYFLIDKYKSDSHVTRQAASHRQHAEIVYRGAGLLQVSAVHERQARLLIHSSQFEFEA